MEDKKNNAVEKAENIADNNQNNTKNKGKQKNGTIKNSPRNDQRWQCAYTRHQLYGHCKSGNKIP